MELKKYLEEFNYSFDFLKKFLSGEIDTTNYPVKTIGRVLCNSSFLSSIKAITNEDKQALKEYAQIIIDYLAPTLSEILKEYKCYLTYDPNNTERMFILNENEYVIFYINVFENSIISLAIPDSYEFQTALETTINEQNELIELKQSILSNNDYRRKDNKVERVTSFLLRYDNSKKTKEKIMIIDKKIAEINNEINIFYNAINELRETYNDVISLQKNVYAVVNRELGFRLKEAKNLEIASFGDIYDFMKENKEVIFYEDI